MPERKKLQFFSSINWYWRGYQVSRREGEKRPYCNLIQGRKLLSGRKKTVRMRNYTMLSQAHSCSLFSRHLLSTYVGMRPIKITKNKLMPRGIQHYGRDWDAHIRNPNLLTCLCSALYPNGWQNFKILYRLGKGYSPEHFMPPSFQPLFEIPKSQIHQLKI